MTAGLRPLLFLTLLASTALASGEGPAAPAPQLAVSPDAGQQVTDPEDKAEEADAEADPPMPAVPSRLTSPPIATVSALSRADDLVARARRGPEGRLLATHGDREELLTLDAELQARLSKILETYDPPYAAVVAMDPRTGRVLAMAESSHVNPKLRGLTTKAVFPAASIFKIVTASALLGQGVKPTDVECARGGKRHIAEERLKDEAGGVCHSLSEALARSSNAIFAKLTHKHLSQEQLAQKATAFHFNRAIPFAVPTDISLAAIPGDALGLATTGAGFGDVYLSPLHGAMLASTIANDGLWRAPVLLEREVGQTPPERVLTPEEAHQLSDMMAETVTAGTARRIFRERGFGVKGAVGKTGSLADRKPFRDYSWFVGYAPKDKPEVAVAAVIVNDMLWRVRAAWLGREAMRLLLEERANARPSTAAR